MGYLLRAKCPSCSFRKDVNFGGRMMDMGSTLFAPVLEKKTGKMIEINLKDTNIVLDRYQLYAEPYDYRDKDLEAAHQWGIFVFALMATSALSAVEIRCDLI